MSKKKNGLGNRIGFVPPPRTPNLGSTLITCSIYHIPQIQTAEVHSVMKCRPVIDWTFHRLKLITVEATQNNMIENFLFPAFVLLDYTLYIEVEPNLQHVL